MALSSANFVKPDSVLARTAGEIVQTHAGGLGPRDGMTMCPICEQLLPCYVGRAAAEVLAAAGLAQSSGLVDAARQGRGGPDREPSSPFGQAGATVPPVAATVTPPVAVASSPPPAEPSAAHQPAAAHQLAAAQAPAAPQSPLVAPAFGQPQGSAGPVLPGASVLGQPEPGQGHPGQAHQAEGHRVEVRPVEARPDQAQPDSEVNGDAPTVRLVPGKASSGSNPSATAEPGATPARLAPPGSGVIGSGKSGSGAFGPGGPAKPSAGSPPLGRSASEHPAARQSSPGGPPFPGAETAARPPLDAGRADAVRPARPTEPSAPSAEHADNGRGDAAPGESRVVPDVDPLLLGPPLFVQQSRPLDAPRFTPSVRTPEPESLQPNVQQPSVSPPNGTPLHHLEANAARPPVVFPPQPVQVPQPDPVDHEGMGADSVAPTAQTGTAADPPEPENRDRPTSQSGQTQPSGIDAHFARPAPPSTQTQPPQTQPPQNPPSTVPSATPPAGDSSRFLRPADGGRAPAKSPASPVAGAAGDRPRQPNRPLLESPQMGQLNRPLDPAAQASPPAAPGHPAPQPAAPRSPGTGPETQDGPSGFAPPAGPQETGLRRPGTQPPAGHGTGAPSGLVRPDAVPRATRPPLEPQPAAPDAGFTPSGLPARPGVPEGQPVAQADSPPPWPAADPPAAPPVRPAAPVGGASEEEPSGLPPRP